jgi:hypothetical protein
MIIGSAAAGSLANHDSGRGSFRWRRTDSQPGPGPGSGRRPSDGGLVLGLEVKSTVCRPARRRTQAFKLPPRRCRSPLSSLEGLVPPRRRPGPVLVLSRARSPGGSAHSHSDPARPGPSGRAPPSQSLAFRLASLKRRPMRPCDSTALPS